MKVKLKRLEIENEKWKWKKILENSREARISLVSETPPLVAGRCSEEMFPNFHRSSRSAKYVTKVAIFGKYYRVSQKKFLIEFLLWEGCLLRPSVKTVALLCMLSPRHLNLQLRGCFCAVRVYTLIQHTDEGHSRPPLAQKAKLCFKLLLLQRLDENLKQKHF